MKKKFIQIFTRLFALFIILIGITALVFASLLQFSPEARATLYLSPRGNRSPETTQRLISQFIEQYQFDDPFHLQYPRWFFNLFRGKWGHSPIFNMDIFNVILRYTPATVELLLYSILLFFPFGILLGVIAGRKKDRVLDHTIQLGAFVANSIPLFILAFLFFRKRSFFSK